MVISNAVSYSIHTIIRSKKSVLRHNIWQFATRHIYHLFQQELHTEQFPHFNSKWKWATTWQNQQNECAPSEDSDQPGHPPSLIRVFAVRMKKAWVLSYPLSAQRRLWSDWADAQADLSLDWTHTHFVGFAMAWLKLFTSSSLSDLRRRTLVRTVQ